MVGVGQNFSLDEVRNKYWLAAEQAYSEYGTAKVDVVTACYMQLMRHWCEKEILEVTKAVARNAEYMRSRSRSKPVQNVAVCNQTFNSAFEKCRQATAPMEQEHVTYMEPSSSVRDDYKVPFLEHVAADPKSFFSATSDMPKNFNNSAFKDTVIWSPWTRPRPEPFEAWNASFNLLGCRAPDSKWYNTRLPYTQYNRYNSTYLVDPTKLRAETTQPTLDAHTEHRHDFNLRMLAINEEERRLHKVEVEDQVASSRVYVFDDMFYKSNYA